MFMHSRNNSLNMKLGRPSRSVPKIVSAFSHWDGAGASIETRKKIVRLLIAEIIADVVDDKLELVIHWHIGDHTCLTAKRNRVGQNQWVTDADVVDLVRILARQMQDESIAAVLNRSGKSTGRGNSWTRSRVCSLRYDNEIAHRHPHCHFRGLLRLYACYGPSDRSATQGDLCHEAPALPVAQPSRSSASGLSTIIQVEPSSTDDSRLRGALPASDSCTTTSSVAIRSPRRRGRGASVAHRGRAPSLSSD